MLHFCHRFFSFVKMYHIVSKMFSFHEKIFFSFLFFFVVGISTITRVLNRDTSNSLFFVFEREKLNLKLPFEILKEFPLLFF